MKEKIYNTLLGCALGDAMGLPYEGLSRSKIAKKNLSFKTPSLIFKKGLFSDDTEHSIIIAQCLIESGDNEKLFEKLLRKRLKLWLLGLPAGMGFATMKAIFYSFFIKKCGVFSAGNAPAMRSALLGVLYGNDNEKLQNFVKINTIITHTDPKAYYGALAVAKASWLSSIQKSEDFFVEIKKLIDDEEFILLLHNVEKNLSLTSLEFAKVLGLAKGVGGYIYQTLPIVLHSWLRNIDNPTQAIIDVILCGGDTDTTGAIVGAIVASNPNAKSFSKEWKEGIIDYPRTLTYIENLSDQLARVTQTKETEKAKRLNPLSIIVRNILFIGVVLVVAITREF